MVVCGPSGSGKSTMIKCVNGLEPYESGSITVDGVTLGPKTDLPTLRARIGMVFQHFDLYPHMNVLQNICLAQIHVLKRTRAEAEARALELLRRVGLPDKANSRPATLSGGQQQRVAIARALVQQPKIVLADEPIASLDMRNARRVMDALRTINRQDGITVICNLHTLETARQYCDRIVALAAGQIVFDGSPRALTADRIRDVYGADDGDDESDAKSISAEVARVRREAEAVA
jgi:glutamate/aspartate transport system ATP-binding protein